MDTEVTEKLILTERRGHVLIITINRPRARNAFDQATSLEMAAAMDLLDAEDDLFVGVITGAGGSFCAGADLKAAARGEGRGTPRGNFGIFGKPSRKPLIAAVEGHAVGGGFEICLSCDLIVAADNATFGLPEVRHNLVATGGGLFRLPRRMPYHLAMEMALTGEFRDAAFLHGHGIVNRLVEPGTAMESAVQWAETMMRNGPTAMAATKQIIFHSPEWSDSEAFVAQQEYARGAVESEDYKEGLAAFAEKRPPVWRGR